MLRLLYNHIIVGEAFNDARVEILLACLDSKVLEVEV